MLSLEMPWKCHRINKSLTFFSNGDDGDEEEAARAVSDLLSGRFRWFLRKRLRITLIGDKNDIKEPPHELHSQQMMAST